MTKLSNNHVEYRPKIIVAIPVFNEEQFIAEVVRKAKESVDKVFVIDDGSTDNTNQVAKAAGASIVRHRSNQGVGRATKSCFEIAKSENADILVTLDGDGQHNPQDIPQIVAPILTNNADLVIGSRFLRDHNDVPKYRQFGIKIITWLYNVGSKTKISDAQSCFRAYGKKALYTLDLRERGFGFSIESLLQARKEGLNIHEVPISCIYHSACHSTNPIIHGISVAFKVIILRLKLI